jgi:hypothetical protein
MAASPRPVALLALLTSCVSWAVPACAQSTAAPIATAVAAPVAILTEAIGVFQIFARGRPAPSEVAAPVEQGATLALEGDARVVLAYPGIGSVYELWGPAQFVAQGSGVERRAGAGLLVRRDLVSALRALQIRPESATVQGSTAMRGGGDLALQAGGPTGTQFAQDAMVVCWRPLGPQWIYRIRVIDDDGSVVFEGRTDGARLTVPATLTLQPRTQYLWHLSARGPNGQTAEAVGEFQRLDASSELALRQAQAVLANGNRTDRTLYEIALRQQGFAAAGASGCEHADGS